jgi:hypothetical protein
MGIRISKVLGYGLQNATRFIDQKKLSEIEEDLYDASLSKLKQLFKKKQDLFEPLFVGAEGHTVSDAMQDFDFVKSARGQIDFYEHLQYNCIGSLTIDEGFVLLPFLCRDWYRYDDSIDFIEEHDQDGPVTRFVHLKRCGIYPYLGMTRFRNPNNIVLPENITVSRLRDGAISPSDYSRAVGWWDPKMKPLAKGDVLKHLLEDYRADIPCSIGIIVTLISNSLKCEPREFLNQLRPCIYVYWS